MIIYLILWLGLLFLFNPLSFASNWEQMLKNPPKKNPPKKDNIRTEGLEIDPLERLVSSTDQGWASKLAGEKAKKSTHSAELADMLNKIAQMDRMLPDDSLAKHVLFSEFAVAYLHAGDFLKAESLSLRSLRMTERLSGKNSEETLRCMTNLALIYEAIGDYERALEVALQSLEICKRNPKAHRNKPVVQGLVAGFQLELGNYEDAEPNAREALDAARSSVKKDDPFVIIKPLRVISSLNFLRGNYTAAKDHLNEALSYIANFKNPYASSNNRIGKVFVNSLVDSTRGAIFSNFFQLQVASGDTIAARKVLSDYEKIQSKRALDLPESIQKTRNLDAAQWMVGKAILEKQSGNETLAKKYADQYLEFHRKNLDAALLLVESQRLNWQRRYLDFSIPVAFCSPEELADIVISWKGIVLDSLSADHSRLRNSKNAADQESLEKISSLRRQLAQMLIQESEQGDEELQILKNRIFSAERAISKKATSLGDKKSTQPDWKSVQTLLSESDAVVELITYRELPDIRNGKLHYGAVVILKNSNPVWVPIASADEVEQVSHLLQQNIFKDDVSDKDIEVALRSANGLLFAKIEAALPPSVSRIYLSPDGILNFTPFSCLLREDNSFVAEKYTLNYIGSARDLLKQSIDERKNQDFKIFANPDFEGQQDQLVSPHKKIATRSLSINQLSQVALPPLPGTETEAQRLSEIAKNLGLSSQVLLGNEATEKNVYQLSSPYILHMGTHGFFLGGHSKPAGFNESGRGMSVVPSEKQNMIKTSETVLSPMLQSGIALAGAKSTLAHWANGKAPDPENDGVLTAEEVSGLDLNETWLVCLSACETGLGEARSGEGVFGLRRAFMIAGTQNLLMTLWPVNDAATADFMGDFYQRALTSKDAPKSLADTQRDWLVNLRREKGLLTAVRDAGPFAIATTEKAFPPPREKPQAIPRLSIREAEKSKI